MNLDSTLAVTKTCPKDGVHLFPRVIPQTMAAGLPVVATAVDGNAEAIVDGVTGTLVPPKDPVALAAGLAALLHDPSRARAMGEAGRGRAAEFDVRRMVDDIEALYTKCLGVRGVNVGGTVPTPKA